MAKSASEQAQLEHVRALAQKHPWLPENIHLSLFRLTTIMVRLALPREANPLETASKRLMVSQVMVDHIEALARATPVCSDCAGLLIDDLTERVTQFTLEYMTTPDPRVN